MVNLNFDQFKKTQKEHQTVYVGSKEKQQPGINDSGQNNQDDTDVSVGAEGFSKN